MDASGWARPCQARWSALRFRVRREASAGAVAQHLRARGTYVVYADGGLPVLVSHRVGCVVQQPEYPGLDLAAMCLKG